MYSDIKHRVKKAIQCSQCLLFVDSLVFELARHLRTSIMTARTMMATNHRMPATRPPIEMRERSIARPISVVTTGQGNSLVIKHTKMSKLLIERQEGST